MKPVFFDVLAATAEKMAWPRGTTRLGRLRMAGVLAAFSLACLPAAHAVDWQVSAGNGSREDVDSLGLGLVWDSQAPLWQGRTWRVRLLHEAQLAFWDVPHASDIIELGYTPMFRWQYGAAGAGNWHPFVEAGIGVRLLSHARLGPDTSLSTAFQFSDAIGAGLQFGSQGRFTVGVRFQHLSNARIKRPNPGVNFVRLYYQQRF